MFKAFIDTNILHDAFNVKREFNEDATLLLFLAKTNEIDVCICGSQITDFIYIASGGEKRSLIPSVQVWLQDVLEFITVIPTGAEDLREVVHCDWMNLEDFLVYNSALKSNCDVLITRDKDDYTQSAIPYMDEHEFFDWYEKNYNIRYCFAELATLPE